MSHKSVAGRFNVMSIGLVFGFIYGIYLLKDYQLIKYSPPNPENFDENGNWKGSSFIKVRFSEHVAPLEKKDDIKANGLDEASSGQSTDGIKKEH